MARRSHPFPYRTRKLSFSAPMVVGTRVPVRVGRCQAVILLFRSSSVVELSAVNRSVVGSNPTCGAILFFGEVLKRLKRRPWKGRRSGNRCEGSNPSFSAIHNFKITNSYDWGLVFLFWYLLQKSMI